MVDLRIDPERVRATAASCPDAARILKSLFPEAFPADDEGPAITNASVLRGVLVFGGTNAIQVPIGGPYAQRAFFLDESSLTWRLERDSRGSLWLIPERRPR